MVKWLTQFGFEVITSSMVVCTNVRGEHTISILELSKRCKVQTKHLKLIKSFKIKYYHTSRPTQAQNKQVVVDWVDKITQLSISVSNQYILTN